MAKETSRPRGAHFKQVPAGDTSLTDAGTPIEPQEASAASGRREASQAAGRTDAHRDADASTSGVMRGPQVRFESPRQPHPARPDETTAFLIASGVDPQRIATPGAPAPARPKTRTVSPDETAVFIAAANQASVVSPLPLRADDTSQFVLAQADSYVRVSANTGEKGSRPANTDVEGPRAAEVTGSLPSLRDEATGIVDREDMLFAPLAPADGSLSDAGNGSAPASSADGAAVPAEVPSAHDDAPADDEAVGRSAAMMSMLVILSRITGFMRTWAQAIGIGGGMVANAFIVANNLPNSLYELVMGGMLVTAFLPVYVSAKKRLGRDGATAYASNLLSVVVLLMGILAVLAFIFAGQVIWTQSFTAGDNFNAELSSFFFRFFAISIVLYALSSIISGVLNAERDYFWSTAAPVVNNIITTVSFFSYGVVAQSNPDAALLILAIGSPLGVLSQVLMQVPALLRHGVRLRLRIDLRDPCLRETVSIGAPTLIVTLVSFATTSVQTSTGLAADPSGASISYYARMWYMLPYSVFAIPITTAMFTELANYVASDDMPSYIRGLSRGSGQILFILIPFALYLMVFSPCLSRLMGGGSMGDGVVDKLASYIGWLALSLPGYGVCTYLQKACSSLRKMKLFAIGECIAGAVQIAACFAFTPVFGLNFVGFSSTLFFCSIDLVMFLILRRELGHIGLKSMAVAGVRALALGGVGAAAGGAILFALQTLMGPLNEGMVQALIYTVVGGVPALLVTFGLAVAFKLPEASFVSGLVGRFTRRRAA